MHNHHQPWLGKDVCVQNVWWLHVNTSGSCFWHHSQSKSHTNMGLILEGYVAMDIWNSWYETLTFFKIAVFWVVAPCSLVEVSSMSHRPDDGGSKDPWNVGKLLPDYTVLQPRRQQSSYSPPWEPQILLNIFAQLTSAPNASFHAPPTFVQLTAYSLMLFPPSACCVTNFNLWWPFVIEGDEHSFQCFIHVKEVRFWNLIKLFKGPKMDLMKYLQEQELLRSYY
jgi:hypothetical protein